MSPRRNVKAHSTPSYASCHSLAKGQKGVAQLIELPRLQYGLIRRSGNQPRPVSILTLDTFQAA